MFLLGQLVGIIILSSPGIFLAALGIAKIAAGG